MDFFTTIILAIGLAMDVFAVSLGVGTSPIEKTGRLVFRLSFHFGLFQGMMTLFGWLAGSTIVHWIEGFDHWLALILLAWIGIRMILSAVRSGDDDSYTEDPSRGMMLVGLSVATSIDALAAGLSMAMMNINLYLACITIALVSTGFSLIGLLLGNALGKRFGKSMEILGGLILISIGIRVVVSHMLS